MKVITVAIQKGGTGKTTSAAILAQAAASRALQVLAIDLDPQGNLSFALGANPAAETGTAYNLLMGRPAAECIHTTAQGLDIIPADRDLAAITSGTGSARRLREALRPVREWYDLIIIDTPPTAGELQYNALMAADGLIIPLQADAYNLQSALFGDDPGRSGSKRGSSIAAKSLPIRTKEQAGCRLYGRIPLHNGQ